MLIDELGRKWP